MATIDAEFSGRMRGSSMTIWLVGTTVMVFLLWAKFAWIDEIVRANGEVVSASRPQIIQNLEGGILAELLVSEGDIVQTGDVIVRLRGQVSKPPWLTSKTKCLRPKFAVCALRRNWQARLILKYQSKSQPAARVLLLPSAHF